jgi:arylsulfatase A-like enzyme/Flp pilus assembly protein TadD
MGRARERKPRSSPPTSSAPAVGRRLRLLVLAVAALVGVGVGIWLVPRTSRAPGQPAAVLPSQPSILLITLDTTRADRLGSYGYGAAATPNLDRLAREGVRFERALSPVPLTLPAHASLLTGRQPFSHGVRNNGHFVLPDDLPTLATVFAARGYDTAAFVSSFVLDRQFGLARGFSHYDDALDQPAAGAMVSLELERRGDRTVGAALRWLGDRQPRSPSKPFFVWVHLYDAHEPYAAPSPFREQFASRPYDGEIAFQDAQVGRLLEAVGYGTPAAPLVAVAGDHGESLGEHGESTHGLFVYDAALRVPMLISRPGWLAPAVVPRPVRLVDLAPTLASLAGVELTGAEGESLRLRLGGVAGDETAPAYAETYFPQFFMQWAPLRAVEAGRWKYIDAPEPELYDLSADPGERTNLADADPARVTTLKRALEGITGAGPGRVAATPLTDDARRRLASLGYLSGSSPEPPTDQARLPDPKRMVDLFEELLDGNRALASDRAGDALGIARRVLAKDPGNGFARLLLGRASLATGRNKEAVAAFKSYLELVPGSADAHHWMALAHLRLGDRSRALDEEEATLAIDPRHTAALALKAGLLFSGGRRDEGLDVLRRAADADPANTTLRIELADLLTDAGHFADAEGEYRRVIAARPGESRALLGLGLVLGATARPDEALSSFNEAVDADARNEEARFARGEVLEQLGQVEAARSDYEWVAREASRADLRQLVAGKLKELK